MTHRHLVALGLADALLAGPADASARQRCERVLGSRARWIGRLADEMMGRFRASWRDNARATIADAIRASPHFQPRFLPGKPVLRAYALTAPHMSPLPLALQDCVVPGLPTPRDLARWLDLDLDELEWLTGPLQRPLRGGFHAEHYCHRWIPKRSGGLRLLEIPKAQLRRVQSRVLRGIVEFVPPHEAAHGFRQRHSCVTNAHPHAAQPVVMRMDLEDFFGSIGGGKVYSLFSALGYPAGTARALTRLTTCSTPGHVWSHPVQHGAEDSSRLPDWHTRKRLASPHLPQGSPASPALANLCAFDFDVRVQALAEKFDLQYTRYADDLTFSGGTVFARRSRALEAHVGAIALEEGLRVNHRKTRVMRAAARQTVTGIVVNDKPNVAREYRDRIKAMLHNLACRDLASLGATASAELALKKACLAGHIAHIAAVNPAHGARLAEKFRALPWP